MKLIENIPCWGDPVFPEALQQLDNARATGAERLALMADHHVGYGVPIGGVVAYRHRISPSGVGYDIACGNKAVRLDVDAIKVKAKINPIMDEVFKKISFGVGRANNEDVDHELFDDEAWKMNPLKTLKEKARAQLGTVGSGNHYVDIFEDEQNRIWVGVHFGSRGLGHGIAQHFMDIAKANGQTEHFISWLSTEKYEGQEYLEAMRVAGEYAYAGRDWVCAKVAKILGGKIVEEVHNHHNFAWKENHEGQEFWVVRKGATPAFPGQRGFVGGSMGDNSVILEGVDSPESREALYSTVHGAGRVMSRTAAKGKGKVKGAVSKEDMHKWIKREQVVLRGAGVDEAPLVYKRLHRVLEHHSSSVKIIHTLKPLGVAMAGGDTFDPYKD
ncbi:MAG: RtcB family protein [Armatimonadetes bacterium]|nr:RtcB family protein [Armatimonadota bacterium]